MTRFCDNSQCKLYRQRRAGHCKHCPLCGKVLSIIQVRPLIWPISLLLLLSSILGLIACCNQWTS